MRTMKPAVARGALLLDAALPGWADKVDVTKLKVPSGRWCVLGQCYGYIRDGLYQLGLASPDSPLDVALIASYGFCVGGGFSRLWQRWELHRILEFCWRDEISDRRRERRDKER